MKLFSYRVLISPTVYTYASNGIELDRLIKECLEIRNIKLEDIKIELVIEQ